MISRGASLSLGQYTLDNISEADVDTYIQVGWTLIYRLGGHSDTGYIWKLFIPVMLTLDYIQVI